MRKKSIGRGVWRISERRRRQTGFFLIGALAGPVIGGITSDLAGPLRKKIIVGKNDEDNNDDTQQYFIKKACCSKKSGASKR